MFLEPPITRLDLRFRVFGVPVRVHPMFWLIAALLGWTLPPVEQVLWIAVVFVSILVHEMGHALSSRRFGLRSHIVLHSMGGLTIPEGAPRRTAGWKHALIALSGPGAGFLLAFAAYLFLPVLGSTASGPFGAFYFHLIWVNLVWGLVNLLPVSPLDGGHVARAILTDLAGVRGYSIASILSFVTAGVVIVVAWQLNQPLLAIFFAYFAFAEWQRSI